MRISKEIHTHLMAELSGVLPATMKSDIRLLLVNKHQVSKSRHKLSETHPSYKGHPSVSQQKAHYLK